MATNRYALHWRNGDIEYVRGMSIGDAMRNAGYGYGAISALDYWEQV